MDHNYKITAPVKFNYLLTKNSEKEIDFNNQKIYNFIARNQGDILTSAPLTGEINNTIVPLPSSGTLGFILSVATNSNAAAKAYFNLTCVNDVNGTVIGTYFIIYDNSGKGYYVYYYKVDSVVEDPVKQYVFLSNYIGIPVKILLNATATTIATTTSTVLNSNPLTSSFVTMTTNGVAVLYFKYNSPGFVKPLETQTSPFTHSVNTVGENALSLVYQSFPNLANLLVRTYGFLVSNLSGITFSTGNLWYQLSSNTGASWNYTTFPNNDVTSLSLTTGIITTNVPGAWSFSASVQFNGSSSGYGGNTSANSITPYGGTRQIKLTLMVTGKPNQDLIVSTEEVNSNSINSTIVTIPEVTFRLRSGDKIVLYVRSDYDSTYQIGPNTYFSGYCVTSPTIQMLENTIPWTDY